MDTINVYFAENTTWNYKRDEEYNRVFLECQINYFQMLLSTREIVFVNEIFQALGLKRTNLGQIIGWSKMNGDTRVDIQITPDNNAQFLITIKPGGFVFDHLDQIGVK